MVLVDIPGQTLSGKLGINLDPGSIARSRSARYFVRAHEAVAPPAAEAVVKEKTMEIWEVAARGSTKDARDTAFDMVKGKPHLLWFVLDKSPYGDTRAEAAELLTDNADVFNAKALVKIFLNLRKFDKRKEMAKVLASNIAEVDDEKVISEVLKSMDGENQKKAARSISRRAHRYSDPFVLTSIAIYAEDLHDSQLAVKGLESSTSCLKNVALHSMHPNIRIYAASALPPGSSELRDIGLDVTYEDTALAVAAMLRGDLDAMEEIYLRNPFKTARGLALDILDSDASAKKDVGRLTRLILNARNIETLHEVVDRLSTKLDWITNQTALIHVGIVSTVKEDRHLAVKRLEHDLDGLRVIEKHSPYLDTRELAGRSIDMAGTS